MEPLLTTTSWIFVDKNSSIVPGVGYKSVATKAIEFTLSTAQGEAAFIGAQYLIAAGEFGVSIVFPKAHMHKFNDATSVIIPPHSTFGFLCHSVNPLKFTITTLTDTINLYIEHNTPKAVY
jgi:hypothetical protein